jgi:prevent-host-death family protein
MKTLPVGQFKANFSEIIKHVKQGEEVGISFGKKKETIAVLIPYARYKKKSVRKLGILLNKASFQLLKDYKMSDDEFLDS